MDTENLRVALLQSERFDIISDHLSEEVSLIQLSPDDCLDKENARSQPVAWNCDVCRQTLSSIGLEHITNDRPRKEVIDDSSALFDEHSSSVHDIVTLEASNARSALRWSNFDSILQRTLLSPLFSPDAVGLVSEIQSKAEQSHNTLSESSPSPCPHMQGRSLPFRSRVRRRIAQGVRASITSINWTIFKGLHLFFYSVLLYRLVQLINTGHGNFSDLFDAFSSVSENGLVSLVRSLARIPHPFLFLIIIAVFLPALFYSFCRFFGIGERREGSVFEETLSKSKPSDAQQFFDDFAQSLCARTGLISAEVSQWIPFPHTAVGRLNTVQSCLRWSGSIPADQLLIGLSALQYVAFNGSMRIQRYAMSSLALIAHSFHLQDLSKFKGSFSAHSIESILQLKAKSLDTLRQLSSFSNAHRYGYYNCLSYFIQLPRVIYSRLLLWWLGFARGRLESFVFFILHAGLLVLEILLLINLVSVIHAAVECPKQPGFTFGEGFNPEWAGSFTSKCFAARMQMFRTVNPNEAVNSLASEIGNYQLSDLTELDLAQKRLTTSESATILTAIYYRGGTKLTNLDLSSNYITSIPTAEIARFQSLKTLLLYGNELTAIGPNDFVGFGPNLAELELSVNKIQSLSPGCFSPLQGLFQLHLGENQISQLPSLPIVNPQNAIGQLAINYNPLGYVNGSFFEQFPVLTLLSLVTCSLSSISPGTFASLRSLTTLYLSYNSLSVLNADTLRGLTSLQQLAVDSNRLTVIGPHTFSQLTALTKLDLSDNQLLYSIDSTAFIHSGPPTLTTLSLNYLRVNHSLTEALRPLSSLEHLFMVSTFGTFGMSNFTLPFLPNLVELDLSDNYLPSGLSQFKLGSVTPNLGSLRVSGLGLPAITDCTLCGLSKLTQLDLSHNSLADLPPDQFQNVTLTFLRLDINRLTALPFLMLRNQSQLSNLVLSFNPLNSSLFAPRMFSTLRSLTVLELGYLSNIDAFPPGFFDGLESLTSLDIAYLQLTSVPPTLFASLRSLQVLSLDGNRVRNMNDLILPSSLTRLSMIDCGLTTPPSAIWSSGQLPLLATLNIAESLLSVPDGSFFGLQQSLTTLDISNDRLSVLLHCETCTSSTRSTSSRLYSRIG